MPCAKKGHVWRKYDVVFEDDIRIFETIRGIKLTLSVDRYTIADTDLGWITEIAGVVNENVLAKSIERNLEDQFSYGRWTYVEYKVVKNIQIRVDDEHTNLLSLVEVSR